MRQRAQARLRGDKIMEFVLYGVIFLIVAAIVASAAVFRYAAKAIRESDEVNREIEKRYTTRRYPRS